MRTRASTGCMVEGPLPLPARVNALDSEDMFGLVRRFVDDLEGAFGAVNDRTCPWLADLRSRPFSGLLCLGMGGSAAGGSVTRSAVLKAYVDSGLFPTASTVISPLSMDTLSPKCWGSLA